MSFFRTGCVPAVTLASRSRRGSAGALLWAVLAGTVAMPAGQALAQDSGATVCRNFCDTDAKQCRMDAKDRAEAEASPFDPNDFSIHSHPQPPRDDFSDEKKLAVRHAADRDRFAASQKCTATRMACVQRCAAPVQASAASAP